MRNNVFIYSAIAFMTVAGIGCHKRTEPTRSSKPVIIEESPGRVRHLLDGPLDSGVQDEMALRKAMQTYLTESTLARDAVVNADLKAAQAAFSKLANYPLTSKWSTAQWLPAWKLWHSTAKEGAQSDDLVLAAAAVGRLGAQCVSCHQAAGVAPKFEPSDWTAPAPKLRDHMQLYEWAVDRMWEGLIAGHDRAWTVGAATFSQEVLSVEKLASAHARKEKLRAWSRQLVAASEAAQRAKTPEERGQKLTAVLMICADCHRQAR